MIFIIALFIYLFIYFVQTGKDAQAVNRQYYQKITQLEQEAEHAKTDLTEAQKQLQGLENKELRDAAEKVKLQKEFRKKMECAKVKVQVYGLLKY